MPQPAASQSCTEKTCLPGVLTHPSSQTQRRNKLQSEAARLANIRENHMVRGKHKNINNRNQCYLASSESSFLMTASPEYPNMAEKKYSGLHLMMMIEAF